MVRRQIAQRQRAQEKCHCQYGRGSGQEIGRSASAEETSRCSSPEACTHVRALAVLQKDEDDDSNGRQQHQPVHDLAQDLHVLAVLSQSVTGGGDDAKEFRCRQRRATDQSAIDIGHLEQVLGIVSSDAAPVNDTH